MKTPFFLGFAFLSTMALSTACSDDTISDGGEDDEGAGATSAGGNGTGGSATGGTGTGGSSTTSAGGMGTGGDASGGMGTGGMGTCYTCYGYVLECQSANGCPDESAICSSSMATFQAVKTCVCEANVCASDCPQTCTGQGQQDDMACITCLQNTGAGACPQQAGACYADM